MPTNIGDCAWWASKCCVYIVHSNWLQLYDPYQKQTGIQKKGAQCLSSALSCLYPTAIDWYSLLWFHYCACSELIVPDVVHIWNRFLDTWILILGVLTGLITMVWFITDCGFSQLPHWPKQRLVWAVSKSWQSLWVLHNLAPVFPPQTLLITLQLWNRLLQWLSICQSQ